MPIVASVGALANRCGGPKHPFFLRPTKGRVALMKRMLLLVTVGLMLAAAMALSGVAQAAPISDKADAQCAKLAIKTLSENRHSW